MIFLYTHTHYLSIVRERERVPLAIRTICDAIPFADSKRSVPTVEHVCDVKHIVHHFF